MADPTPTPETDPVKTDDDLIASLIAPEEPATDDVVEEAPLEEAEAEEAASDESADVSEEETDEVVEESDPQDEEVDPEEVYVVKVNGEELEVSFDELTKGYSRTEDYKVKTRDLADERRAFAQEQEQWREEAASARAQMLALLNNEPQEPDWEQLKAEDPIGYAETFADWQRGKHHREQQKAVLQQEQDQRVQAFQAQTAQKAVSVFPEWSTGNSFSEGMAARTEAALALGFTEAELSANHDYRVFAALEKAARWDALQAEKSTAKAKVVKRVRAAPKVKQATEAPKGKAQREARDAEARKSRFKRTGSLDDAVALLME